MNTPNRMPIKVLSFCLSLIFAFCGAEICFPQNVKIQNMAELRSALKTVAAGSTIEIMPGIYDGGIGLANIHGRIDSPIVVTGADAKNPPVFEGLNEGLKVTSSSYIKFKDIIFRGFLNNGINIDDGGNFERPSHHIRLENIRIENIGPKSNSDALKMSGVRHFIIRKLQIEGWGGSAIDLVGCHYGVIEQTRFVQREGFRTGNTIQIKGGSRHILVQSNLFVSSGSRVVQIGGSTALQYFRPGVQNYEAKDVMVAGNTFIGGEAQILWITAQDTVVHHNLFYQPQKWLGRIAQETSDKRFRPCQRGIFEKNLIVLNTKVRRLFSVGVDTRPETFFLRGNVWNLHEYEVASSLPSMESAGVYGIDPELRRLKTGQLMTVSTHPAVRSVGPWAYRPLEFAGEFPDIRLPAYRFS